MSARAWSAVVVAGICVAACSHTASPQARTAAASSAPAAVAARPAPAGDDEAARERAEHASGPMAESGAREVMERLREISPYAPTEEGLGRFAHDVVEAAQRGDRARVEALVGDVVPTRDRLRLVLTFEGDRALGAALTAPAQTDREALAARAMGWARLSEVTVSSARGEQIAQGADGAAVNPAMRTVAASLRPLTTWYRVTLRAPGAASATVLESFVYAAGRWLYVADPWRAAVTVSATPGGGAVNATPAWATRLQRAMGPGAQPGRRERDEDERE